MTNTIPPVSLLDTAEKYNLKVMASISFEQHFTYLDDAETENNILKQLTETVLEFKDHPALLCYVIGNEIPAAVVARYGKKKIETLLKKLYRTVKNNDKNVLITYVNYSETEYLDLGFLDFACFNLYPEDPEKIGTYIAHLQNISGDQPMVITKIGLRNYRNAAEKKSAILSQQVETVFEKGAAGICMFTWSNEAHSSKEKNPGLVISERNFNPSLLTVLEKLGKGPFCNNKTLPSITVIVCTYNGSATIHECLEGIFKLDYPNFDVIVVNDGSTDNVQRIIRKFPAQLISTLNRGLSSARNTGMRNAKGDIIAYIDDDAYPDPDWLTYLANEYLQTSHACIGGPTIAPYGNGFIATCIANVPGLPDHALLSDEIAEYVSGCNISFRKEALLKIGGFDPVYEDSGDDLDICWRIQESGGSIGFHPSALVWHHPVNSLKAYWKQQIRYGKMEALLETKWPGKFNTLGQITWTGSTYRNGFTLPLNLTKETIVNEPWGDELIRSVENPGRKFINSIPLIPELHLLCAIFFFFGCLGFLWTALLWFFLPFTLSLMIVLPYAIINTQNKFSLDTRKKNKTAHLSVIILLRMIQPLARLTGRYTNGLTPWRNPIKHFPAKFLFVFGTRVFTHRSTVLKTPDEWLQVIEKNLLALKLKVKKEDAFDDWNIQVNSGFFAKCRCFFTAKVFSEEKQFLKIKCYPVFNPTAFIVDLILLMIASVAAFQQSWAIMVITGSAALLLAIHYFVSTATVLQKINMAFRQLSVITSEQTESVTEVKKIHQPEKHVFKEGSITRQEKFFVENKTEKLQVEQKLKIE